MTFDSFGLPSSVLSNIKNLGYTAPTPIQERAIPTVMEGRDLMGLAQTGTGKTAAFLLPIIAKLLKKPEAQRRTGRKARALILAPTRELAEQIHEAALELSRNTGLRSTTVYGGVNMNRQITAMRNGADIVVACPGRLLDHMGQRTADLTAVEHLVLDEADQMFDMGFLPDIRKILAGLPKERQTMLFSATMPEAIRQLATDILREPETVNVGHSAPAETVSHAIYPVPHHLKTKLLLDILDRNTEGSVLVFTRTKHRAKRLAESLGKMGHKSTELQGNLSQNRRKEAMDGFRSGRFRVLVATDIAARGIDVSQVTHVVNFDVPSTPETYTHRIGRTGRAARTGEAHTFVTGEDMSMVRAIERLMREPLPRKRLDGFNYDELPSNSAADKDFNRPIMDGRGRGRGNAPRFGGNGSGHTGSGAPTRGSRPGGGYAAAKPAGFKSAAPRDDRRDDRRDERRDGYRDGNRDGYRSSGYGAPRDNASAAARSEVNGNSVSYKGTYADGCSGGVAAFRGAPGAEHNARTQQGAGRRTYGALRSDNSDRYDNSGNRPQPGDDIYAVERGERRSYGQPRRDGVRQGAPRGAESRPGQARSGQPRRDDRPRNDRPQGDRPYGDRPRSARPAGNRPEGTRPERRPEGLRPEGIRPERRPEGNRQDEALTAE